MKIDQSKSSNTNHSVFIVADGRVYINEALISTAAIAKVSITCRSRDAS
ncbi:phage tail tip fiber protein [Pseudomonas putida]